MINKNSLVYFLVCLFLVVLTIHALSTNYNNSIEYQKEIYRLQTQADSISEVNVYLDKTINNLYQKIDSLDTALFKINVNIVRIREDAKNRINSIDTTGHEQLLRFFTDRYN